MRSRQTTRIIVLDDDPTGSQTVHGCLLLTQWDTETLCNALLDPSPLFFVLTNTRAMSPESAAAVARDVCSHLRDALDRLSDRGIAPLVVSRSDSTLRGHYPVETNVIEEELGPFDAHFLVPAFLEAGRITRDSVHYVVQNGRETPAHETEFAQDPVFGYRHSYLPDYVEEKTGGGITADRVHRFALADIRAGSLSRLNAMEGNACAVVDAEKQSDLDRFARDLLASAASGKRFLLRSAASVLTSLAGLPAQPVQAQSMGRYARASNGAVVVGSFVGKTTEQLRHLLQRDGVQGVEVDVGSIATGSAEAIDSAVLEASRAHAAGLTPVIYTSRDYVSAPNEATQLELGKRISRVLVAIVRRLPPSIGFLVGKGGITSNDILRHALNLRQARLLGQILTGCSVVRCPEDHPRYPDLPVVIFPGNVGGEDGLSEVYLRLSATRSER